MASALVNTGTADLVGAKISELLGSNPSNVLLAVVFFLKIQLPGHRTEYWGWEGIRVWGIVPSQETAVVMFVSDFAAVAMALVGRAIGKVIRKHATNSRRS